MNLKIVKELMELIKNTDVVEIEWTPERIHIIRAAGQPDRTAARSREQEKGRAVQAEKPTVTVTSPLVGTFYRSASPETQPFVQVGDRVKKDQVLCVIEAMKLMNEIESQVDGVVTAILKQDGERVGYGDQLFIIEEL
ncbi:MAG: acetyl-CoA carboxylase biotin carboxyl carrier protein [Bacteriovoracaceae bacterium]|jgi:acetyl-CoA carboxylase biotin carboxyl carrier protein|nr:acetyl-CoA carboxylase biotin carboxyl carrier protein [Bacteriovoracaceae bacterium]HNR52708.1 acetyl-CoA carboxylase biotin carboxyl carrier protein [Deltaproteobacteria bacterium]HRR22251.1 acetyl-CoA carboxylase biotin carboxyl carrier protein [Desulfomonilia bacterium]HRR68489.1 acetyl-CoA carboxylase biotin carboxyl carrier protein [Desulfomonilia bacterium]HRT45902.1 acetyl-CoA carboxylase biotin carboxyl carrier protein [Desulfomonilia bacterium]